MLKKFQFFLSGIILVGLTFCCSWLILAGASSHAADLQAYAQESWHIHQATPEACLTAVSQEPLHLLLEAKKKFNPFRPPAPFFNGTAGPVALEIIEWGDSSGEEGILGELFICCFPVRAGPQF